MQLYDVYRETLTDKDALYDATGKPVIRLTLIDALLAARLASSDDLDAWFTVTKALTEPVEIWDDVDAILNMNVVNVYMHGRNGWTRHGAKRVQLEFARELALGEVYA